MNSGEREHDENRSCEVLDYEATFAIDADERYLLHNRTPRRICIVNQAGDEIVLAPLSQRVVVGARLCPFQAEVRQLRQRHQLRVREYRPANRVWSLATMAMWLSVAVLAVAVLHSVLTEGTLERRAVLVTAIVAAAALAVLLGGASLLEVIRQSRETIADSDEGDIEFGVGGAFYDGNETLRRTKHVFTLLTVVLLGAVLPAIAIFVATDAKDFLVMRGGLQFVDGHESELVGRIIQVTYTAVLSLFPAMLYFQFDRHRVGTLRTEWVRAIFRMDRRMETLADVNARYGDELAEASTYSTDSARLLGGRNSPIVIATLLISLGWTLLVIQTDSFRFDRQGAVPDDPFFEFLVPTPTAATMAFLGAYFFGTYLLLRGYFQGDLRPKIYNQISARLITVVVLAYLIQTLFFETNTPNRVIWAMSFMAGFVPTTTLQQVSRLASTAFGTLKRSRSDDGAFGEVFAVRRKLTQIDGLDIHDSTRLESEGIMDIPTLASADLVSLMINTRLPIGRLVDWMDQAVLILLIGDPISNTLDPRVSKLRGIGIRTASAGLAVAGSDGSDELRTSIDHILKQHAKRGGRALTHESLAKLIRREPAMRRIREWHASELALVGKECATITVGGAEAPQPSMRADDADAPRAA